MWFYLDTNLTDVARLLYPEHLQLAQYVRHQPVFHGWLRQGVLGNRYMMITYRSTSRHGGYEPEGLPHRYQTEAPAHALIPWQ